MYRSDLKHGVITAIQRFHIIETLDREELSFQFLCGTPVARSFPRLNPSVEAVEVLRKVLFNGNISRDLNIPGVHECYSRGWLHSEALDYWGDDIVLVYPTRLHAKLVCLLVYFSLEFTDSLGTWRVTTCRRLFLFPFIPFLIFRF